MAEEYLHLYLQDAKINILNNFKKLNLQDSKFGNSVQRRVNKV